MPPTLAAPDRQALWKPTWLFACAALPHTYAVRDLSVPAASLHAWGHLTQWPTVTRRITDPFWPVVAQSDIRLKVAAALTGDYAAQPFTLSRYDEAGAVTIVEYYGVISRTIVDRDGTTIEGVGVDRTIFEALVPKGVITTTDHPLADPSAVGKTCPWVFGNVRSLPLLYVNDDVVNSLFDYKVCRGTAAAISALRRLNPSGGAGASVDIAFTECEASPGADAVVENPGFEDFDAGITSAPTGWTLSGAGATVAKVFKSANPNRVDTGEASVQLTRVGADCSLSQTISANTSVPLSFWQGRTLTVTARVRATAVDRAYLGLFDGVGTTFSTTHSGSGNLETLTVTRTLDAAATGAGIQCSILTGNTSSQFDTIRLTMRAQSWEEVVRPDLYAGYTAVRFFLRQDDANDQLYQIVADVAGLQAERNPVRAVRTLLADATHGVGRAVDATSFDAAEALACQTYEAAVLLDNPTLFLPFRDPVPQRSAASVVMHDRSGAANHGTVFNAAALIPIALGGPGSALSAPVFGNSDTDTGSLALPSAGTAGTYGSVPSRHGYSGQSIAVEFWIFIYAGNLPDTTQRPIVEKLVGTTTLSGYGFYRQSNALVFFVRGANTTLYTATSALVDVTDEGRWIHVVGVASGGVLTIYRGAIGTPAVSAGTGAYTGAMVEGDGEVLIGRFGGGTGAAGRDWLAHIALYATPPSAARIAAHTAAIALDNPVPVTNYLQGVAALSPTFFYFLGDEAGSAVMLDIVNATNGTYTGSPSLGFVGALNQERGYNNGFGTIKFNNDVTQYGQKTGLTLANAAGSVLVWYRPTDAKVNSGIVEKNIGGTIATQWGLAQRRGTGAIGIIRFTFVATSGTVLLDAPMTADMLSRWMFIAAQWSDSADTVNLYINGALVKTATYAGTAVSGVGDIGVGIQSGPTRPAKGRLGLFSYHPSFLTPTQIADLWKAGTWYNGGTFVDAALTEPRQVQDWLGQIGQLVGLRLGFTATGTITAAVDVTAPTVIQVNARDGAGDGDRTIVEIGGRGKPALDDRVRDVVVQYRRDLLTGAYLGELRRPVSTLTDAQGQRIGLDRVFACEAVREHPTADRFANRAAGILAAREDSVDVTLHQEARRLLEGDLVQVTDALMGYNSTVMRVQEVRKALATIEATLEGYNEAVYTYTPASFPAGATSG